VVVDAGQSKVQCDQPSTATASQLTYTGHGATYNGQELTNPYSSGTPGPLYFGNPGDASPSQPLTFTPPPLPANKPINVLSPTGNPVRNDNTSSAAYLGTGDGLSPAEQYIAIDPLDPSSTTPIAAGETTILKNLATGQFCRLTDISALPGSTQAAGTQGLVCDQPTAATATIITYTGNGLAYNGTPLVAAGPGQPLVLNGTSGTPAEDGTLAFPLAPPCESHLAQLCRFVTMVAASQCNAMFRCQW
jgi:hypothetical protein